MRYRTILLLLGAALLAFGLAACGDDDEGDEDGETAAAETGTAAGAAGALTIKMGDFFFDPKDATAEAGAVTISAPNVGQVEHELELFKSDAEPGDLPVSGDTVDTEAFEEEGAEEIGEAEAEPGETDELSADLDAGKYVMICNVPGHYQKGMYGSLTAK